MYTSMKWKPEFEVGIHQIDKQHKILFDLISDLNKTAAITFEKEKIINTILDVLRDFVFHHFETEEDYFKNHPDYIHHSQEHYQLIKTLNTSIIDFRNSRLADHELAQFLNKWLIDHILDADLKILQQPGEEFTDLTSNINGEPLELMGDNDVIDEYGLEYEERRHYQRIQRNDVVDEKITAHCFNATTMKNSSATIINMSAGGLLLEINTPLSINDLLIINCQVGRNFKMEEKVRVKTVNNSQYGVEFISPAFKTVDFFKELYGAVHHPVEGY